MVAAGRSASGNRRQTRLTAMSQDGPAINSTDPQGADAALRLEDFLPYRLNVVASLASQALSRIYSERYGIGVPEWRVLVTLGQFGVMTGKQIGTHSHMHKTKVSRAVAQLETRKLVARKANRADKREAFLSLTGAGRAIYEDLAPSALEFAQRLAEVIEPGDRAAFDRALKRLSERSAALAAETSGPGAGKPGAAKPGPDKPHPVPGERKIAVQPQAKEDA
jgi:DNA-binding MarR family transcriptional regulator